MKKNIKALNATDFYKYLTCPHWQWFELYATVAEKKTKRSLTQGEIRRLDDGYLHEKVVMRERMAGKKVKALAEVGDAKKLFAATLKAMASGVEIIYQVTLVDGDWHGRPDLLVRVLGASKLGNWHYVPLDIKASHELKPAHRHQLTFYSFLLERIQGVFPEKAGIINRDKEDYWFEPCVWVSEFENVLAKLEALRAGEKPPLVLRKACTDTSPWGDACKKQALDAVDVAQGRLGTGNRLPGTIRSLRRSRKTRGRCGRSFSRGARPCLPNISSTTTRRTNGRVLKFWRVGMAGLNRSRRSSRVSLT